MPGFGYGFGLVRRPLGRPPIVVPPVDPPPVVGPPGELVTAFPPATYGRAYGPYSLSIGNLNGEVTDLPPGLVASISGTTNHRYLTLSGTPT